MSAESLKWKQGEGLDLNVMPSSNTVLKRTEELLYPIESFVSEFGGALGMFLGFSFVMVWDVLIQLFPCCLKFKSIIDFDKLSPFQSPAQLT